MEQTESTAAW